MLIFSNRARRLFHGELVAERRGLDGSDVRVEVASTKVLHLPPARRAWGSKRQQAEKAGFASRPVLNPSLYACGHENAGAHEVPEVCPEAVVARAINGFTPRMPAKHWEPIADQVRAWVAEVDPSPGSAGKYLSASARHVDYCVRVCGYPLDAQVIFRRDVIADFVAKRLGDVSASTRSNYRAALNVMNSQLVEGPQRLARQPLLGRTERKAPHSAEDIAALRMWAHAQKTQHRRVNAHVFLDLGLGAGLWASEMCALEAQHVEVDEYGVVLHVPGKNARSVPMVHEWSSSVKAVAQAAMRPDQRLFLPGRRGYYRAGEAVGDWTQKTNDRPFAISSTRLRTTWITNHLTRGVPVQLLCEAAGIELSALVGYVKYVPAIDTPRARYLLGAKRNPDVEGWA